MISYLQRLKAKLIKPKKTLCTVTFIYNLKGVIGSAKDKTHTEFAWIVDGSNTHDCADIFNPVGINKANCTITNVIVLPIKTVYAKD